ncbi:MAG TPA: alpha/beta hydrolase [Polyangia bacterium]|nr:alpha/beta hydrolase [Polyangia bacterium]
MIGSCFRWLAVCAATCLIALPALAQAATHPGERSDRAGSGSPDHGRLRDPLRRKSVPLRQPSDETVTRSLHVTSLRSKADIGLLGKLEEEDVLPQRMHGFRQWRESVAVDAGHLGNRLPMALVEAGQQGKDTITILHFHGASVRPDNILLWRMAESVKRLGASVRIVAPSEHESPESILNRLTENGEKVIVAGHSMGAEAAMRVAARYPAQVAAVVTYGAGLPLSSWTRVPQLHFQGSNDGGALGHLGAKLPSHGAFAPIVFQGKGVTSVLLEGVDHSLRLGPGTYGPGGKATYNDTVESAEVIDGVMRMVLNAGSAR